MGFQGDRSRIGGAAFAGAMALALASGAARAQDYGDLAPSGVELGYGVAIVSDYVDDGVTQSDNHPALQGYFEASYGILFAGVWASTVAFEDSDDNVEFDLYFGFRHAIDDVELSFAYYRYLYDDTGDCCGEFVFGAEYEATEAFTGEFEFSWDPEEDTTWTAIAGTYSFADRWSVLASLGTDFGSESEAEVEEEAAEGEDEDGGDSEHTLVYELGIAYALNDFSELSLSYYHSNKADSGVVVGVAFDF